MEKKQILRIVWDNREDRRYVPMSYSGGTGWGVFDQTEKKFVDDRLADIDPNEPLAKN